MTVGALVLAAGRGVRMGGPAKPTLDLAGRPLVAHAVDAALAAGLPVLVVVGDRSEPVREALAGRDVGFVEAADHAAGLSASLRAGLAAAPRAWRAVLVVLGDMPHVRADTLAALAARCGPAAVVVPVHGGRRGNPVGWGRDHFAALAGLTGDTGGRALLDRVAVTPVAVDDPGVLVDIDTPADLARARGTP